MKTSEPIPGVEYTAFPGTVVIDTREQLPFAFAEHSAPPRRNAVRVYRVPIVIATLRSGDYSLVGQEDRIAVERKSKADLFGTVGQGRERFVRELARMNAMEFAAVAVECELSDILAGPPKHSKLRPRTVVRSVIAWQQRFPRVHWWFAPGRQAAEIITLRIFERWIADDAKRVKELAGTTPKGNAPS